MTTECDIVLYYVFMMIIIMKANIGKEWIGIKTNDFVNLNRKLKKCGRCMCFWNPHTRI
jgi:hypothetical protein